ncbi:MAG: hypothetical protein RLZZ107_2044, partial [Bacteroidota bacterium]
MNVVKSTLPKVLFVIDTLEVGGAEQSLLENLKRFDKIEPMVCHLYKGDALKKSFIDHGIKVFSVNSIKKYGFGSNMIALDKIISEQKPDAIVAYLTRSELVSRMVALKHQIPVFGTFVSDLYSNTYNKSLSFKAKISVRIFKFLNIITAPLCKGFIANSEAVKIANAKQLHIDSFKIEVINRGRDENKFKKIQDFNAVSDKVNFINVGRLVPVKGQLELIRAFSNLVAEHSNIHLSIAGEGPCRKELESEIEKREMHNYITLLGSVSNLHERLPGSDCFLFPSHSEGFSGSVVEAMMSGVPVVVSDIAVNKEVVTHGYNGYLFEAGSEESLLNAMKWFLT